MSFQTTPARAGRTDEDEIKEHAEDAAKPAKKQADKSSACAPQVWKDDAATEATRNDNESGLGVVEVSATKIGAGMRSMGILTIQDIIRSIKDDNFRDVIEDLRRILAECGGDKNHPDFKAAKTELDAVVIAGKIKGEIGGAWERGDFEPSGFLQIDIDGVAAPENVRDKLRFIDYIVSAFVSPSGDGVKAIAYIGKSRDANDFKNKFEIVEKDMAHRGHVIDPTCKNPNRLMFATWDPDAWTRTTPAIPLKFPKEITPPAKSTKVKSASQAAQVVSVPVSQKLVRKLKEKSPMARNLYETGRWQDHKFKSQSEADFSLGCTICEITDDPATQGALFRLSALYRDERKLALALKAAQREVTKNEGRPVWRMSDVNQSDGKSLEPSLRERAYALRFDPNEKPPPDETCMVIGDIPIAARGNLTAIQGKSKVGKTAVTSAIIGAGQRGSAAFAGDTLCFSWVGVGEGAIIHLDTEQSRSDWHSLVSRSIIRSGMPEVSDRLVSLPLVMFARSEREEILRESLKFEMEARGGIDAVIIDGVADLCQSPNDEAESLELISNLMALSQEFNCAIFCVLHENPASTDGKTRGHLGSELNRKAFANLRIDKDSETSVSTIYGLDMRKRDIPRDQGFCFGWDDAIGMHVFRGRARGLKAAQKEAEAFAKSWAEWEPIFERAVASGTEGSCPALTPCAASEIEKDMNGTKKATTTEAMKKRMQRADSLGVLLKSSPGHWTLNTAGQPGPKRDKWELSPP